MRYMLITVYNRKIVTEIFESFDAARKDMMDGVWIEIRDSYFDIDEAEQFMNDESHTWDDVLGFGKNHAWSNVNDDYPMNWHIVEIPD